MEPYAGPVLYVSGEESGSGSDAPRGWNRAAKFFLVTETGAGAILASRTSNRTC